MTNNSGTDMKSSQKLRTCHDCHALCTNQHLNEIFQGLFVMHLLGTSGCCFYRQKHTTDYKLFALFGILQPRKCTPVGGQIVFPVQVCTNSQKLIGRWLKKSSVKNSTMWLSSVCEVLKVSGTLCSQWIQRLGLRRRLIGLVWHEGSMGMSVLSGWWGGR